MKMASSTVFGIVLAVAMFSTGVMVERMTNVYITNLPLDSEGNLKIKTADKPLQTYKDSVSICVLDFTQGYPHYTQSSPYGGSDWHAQGVRLSYIELEFPFSFSPKQELLRVTGLMLTMAFARQHDRDFNFTITLNGISTKSRIIRGLYPYVGISTTKIADSTIHQAITSGTNFLILTNPMEWVWELNTWQSTELTIYQITVYIEYEYQA